MHFRNIDKDGRTELMYYSQEYNLPMLSQNLIEKLEQTKLFSPFQKAQLIQLTTGTRHTTEIWNKDSNIEDIFQFLIDFPFHLTKLSFNKKIKLENNVISYENFTVIQVSASDYIKKYIENYWQTFSSYDQGILYGYPSTSIAAFNYLIERHPFTGEERNRYTVSMESIGPGIYSKKFFDAEKDFYEEIWLKIKGISQEICNQCENYLNTNLYQ